MAYSLTKPLKEQLQQIETQISFVSLKLSTGRFVTETELIEVFKAFKVQKLEVEKVTTQLQSDLDAFTVAMPKPAAVPQMVKMLAYFALEIKNLVDVVKLLVNIVSSLTAVLTTFVAQYVTIAITQAVDFAKTQVKIAQDEAQEKINLQKLKDVQKSVADISSGLVTETAKQTIAAKQAAIDALKTTITPENSASVNALIKKYQLEINEYAGMLT